MKSVDQLTYHNVMTSKASRGSVRILAGAAYRAIIGVRHNDGESYSVYLLSSTGGVIRISSEAVAEVEKKRALTIEKAIRIKHEQVEKILHHDLDILVWSESPVNKRQVYNAIKKYHRKTRTPR